MEYATRSCIAIDPLMPQIDTKKDEIMKKIKEDPDVQFHWCHLTSNHEEVVAQEVLHRIVCKWLNTHGHYKCAAFMEDYKEAQRIALQAEKALRKELK